MAYVEGDKVVIRAFHDGDMKRLFKKLGIWKDFTKGKMTCVVCGKVLNDDNFGALVPYEDMVRGACAGLCISKAQKLVGT